MSTMSEPEGVQGLADLLEQLPEDLARRAFTHASWVGHRAESYERLAFLGDVVLSLAVSTHLYPRFERYGAGRLTKVRAQAVSGASCAAVALDLGVRERLRAAAPAGMGRSLSMLADSERVLASVCEAVIGAAYLAFGFERVAPAVVAAFEEAIDEALENPIDYKSVLQERLARRAEVVSYRIESEEGPAHDRSFVAVAEVDGRELGRGTGKTKKGAEQGAAMHALDELLGPR
jgi:ribonuclease III